MILELQNVPRTWYELTVRLDFIYRIYDVPEEDRLLFMRKGRKIKHDMYLGGNKDLKITTFNYYGLNCLNWENNIDKAFYEHIRSIKKKYANRKLDTSLGKATYKLDNI